MKVRIALLALAFFASTPFAAEPAKKEPSPAQLAQQEKTQARIGHMLKTGKPLRN